jgi:hypothetical protein
MTQAYIPFEALPMEEAHGMPGWSEALDRLANLALLTVVLRNSPFQSLDDWQSILPPRLTLTDSNVLFSAGSVAHDFGLHVDGKIPPANQSWRSVNLHEALDGSAVVSVLPFNPAYIQTKPYASVRQLITPQDKHEFTRGFVDPAKFSVCYQTTTHPGDVVAFIEGMPLAHDFRTRTLERSSISYGACLTPP